MKFLKTTVATTCTTLLLASGLTMAASVPKAVIEKSSHSKSLSGSATSNMTKRGKTWHYGEVNDNIIFVSNISIANKSGGIVYSSVDFLGMNIHDEDYITANDVINNITTNFQFSSVHLTLSDSNHIVFFDGNVYPNTHFTIRRLYTEIAHGVRSAEGKSQLQLVRD
ncbi:MAG: hypothetical protein K2X50_07280 [Gammaproteobacteria bacterium]|nr:hypothetical protein [Gammaproteobacteria bacterium]